MTGDEWCSGSLRNITDRRVTKAGFWFLCADCGREVGTHGSSWPDPTDELRALSEAAVAGPWRTWRDHRGVCFVVDYEDDTVLRDECPTDDGWASIELAVALVNAYRSGSLVAAEPLRRLEAEWRTRALDQSAAGKRVRHRFAVAADAMAAAITAGCSQTVDRIEPNIAPAADAPADKPEVVWTWAWLDDADLGGTYAVVGSDGTELRIGPYKKHYEIAVAEAARRAAASAATEVES